MNYYMITYDTSQNIDSTAFHKVVTQLSVVKDWWHYLPSSYIVSSEATSSTIADKILAQAKGLRFLVVRVDIRDYNGVLNKAAWEWFKSKNKGIVNLKVVSKPQPVQLPSILPDKPLNLDSLPPILRDFIKNSK